MTSIGRCLFALVPFVLLLSACGDKGSKSGGGLVIPQDINFDEKALPAISDQDFINAKALALTIGQAQGIEGQVLIGNNQSWEERTEREREFNKLSPQKQQMALDLRQVCQTDHRLDESPIQDIGVGKTALRSESKQSIGAHCPVNLLQTEEMRSVVTAYTENPLSFAANFQQNQTFISTFNDSNHIDILGSTGTRVSINVQGRLERNQNGMKSYAKATGTFDVQLVRNSYGAATGKFTLDLLISGEMQKTLASFHITENGKTYVFTKYTEPDAGGRPVTRHYIGNRRLTRAEVDQLDGFPLNTNEAGPLLNGTQSSLQTF